MKYAREFVTNTVVGGLLVVLPVYLTVLLLLKGMQAVVGLVRPVAALLPAWVPAEDILALLIVLVVCAGIGLAVRTRAGRAVRERIEKAFFSRLPGYALFRSLTQQLAGRTEGTVWKPALVEIEDAWCRPSSSRRLTMIDTPSSCPRRPPPWPARCTSSVAHGSIRLTFRLRKPSGAYPSGDPDRRRWLQR
jgi:hypothetical protein